MPVETEKQKPAGNWFILTPESLCGCGNGRKFGECHLKDGTVTITCKNFIPPGLTTGDSIRKCHFAFTYNCGGRISGEHILSRAVLKHIDEKKVRFRYKDLERVLPLNSDHLKTKCLCIRHNSAFNDIDTQAGRLIEFVQLADRTLALRPASAQRAFFFHGWDIERWFLKTLLNVFRAKLSVPVGARLPKDVYKGFSGFLRPPYGLYFPGVSPTPLTIGKEISSFLLYSPDSEVEGICVRLSGIEMKLIIGGSIASSDEFQSRHAYRPTWVNFFQGEHVVNAYFGWENQGSNQNIWISKGDPEADSPTGIIGLETEKPSIS